MRDRRCERSRHEPLAHHVPPGYLVAGAILLSLVPLAAGQTGDPIPVARDLQGVWDFRSAVPFERPEELADRATLTAEEAAAFEQERIDAQNVDLWRDEQGRLPVSGGYNNFWYDRGTSIGEERRTSLVVDPPEGRIPARTADSTGAGRSQTDTARSGRPPAPRIAGPTSGASWDSTPAPR